MEARRLEPSIEARRLDSAEARSESGRGGSGHGGSVGGAAIAAGAMASVLGWKTVFALVFGFASGCVTTLSVVAYRRFVSGV